MALNINHLSYKVILDFCDYKNKDKIIKNQIEEKMKFFILFIFSMLPLFQVAAMNTEAECLPEYQFDGKKITLTEKEWKEKLTPEQFYILREHGTEKPFENLYDTNKAKGIYVCAGCTLPYTALRQNMIPERAGQASSTPFAKIMSLSPKKAFGLKKNRGFLQSLRRTPRPCF